MGGAVRKDPGRMNYEEHNIYLNFITTYGRILPSQPITIYQKTLFLFWISVILIWILLIISKTVNYRYKKLKGKEKELNEIEENDDSEKEEPDGQQDAEDEGSQSSKQMTFQSEENKIKDVAAKMLQLFRASSPEQPPFEGFLFNMIIFGLIMFYFWLCDNLHIWPKVEKQYSRDAFIFLFGLLLFVSITLTRKTTKDKLINRDQTEEWKGWMQVQFVWFHYFDAKEILNSVRCYIAGYVWMTGFGNFSYFWNRKDYSLYRLLKMLFRLNFLVFVVMAVTNHEFVRYYICAMHTYWFLSVWAMMAVLHEFNHNRWFMGLKFVLYAFANSLIFEIPGVAQTLFNPFRYFLNVDGKMNEFNYRMWLDHWTTLSGMLVAYNHTSIENLLKYLDTKTNLKFLNRRRLIHLIITFIVLIIMILWFNYILFTSKDWYIAVHPYTSHIPIFIYLFIRNMHPLLRTYYIGALAWLGKITLETYIAQIHMYMIGNAKKILVYLPNYPLLNFFISTFIYIVASCKLFHLTVYFSSYIIPKDYKVILKNFIFTFIWLGLCAILAYLLTYNGVWSTEKSGLEFLIWKINSTIIEVPK